MNLIIDAHALICRAYFGMKTTEMRTQAGEPTWAVFGYVQELMAAIGQVKPRAVATCWDFPARTIRHEIFEQYKANRGPKPDDLLSQLKLARKVTEAFGIAMFEQEAYEADDLIATLAQFGPCEIFTGDRDMLQLVSDERQIAVTISGVRHDEQAVFARMGVWPWQIADLKGLAGDSSDNIPGIRGIGEKTAAKLLAQETHPYVDDERFIVSKELATLFIIPEITWDQAPLALNLDTLTEVFKHMEFKSLQADLEVLCRKPPKYLILDFETTGLLPGVHEPIQVAAILVDEDLRVLGQMDSLIRPLWPENATSEALAVNGRTLESLDGEAHPEDVLADLCELSGGAPFTVVGHNVDFDLGFMAAAESRFGLTFPHAGFRICTLELARIQYPDAPRHKLATVAEYLGISCPVPAHDAVGDVLMTLELFRRIKRDNPDLIGRAERGELANLNTTGKTQRTWGSTAGPAKETSTHG